VPPGAVRMQVCRYKESLGQESGEVAEKTFRSTKATRRLTSLLNALSPAPGGQSTCAEPTSRLHYLVIVTYGSVPAVYVRIVFEGCDFVRNEVDPTSYSPSRDLRRQLKRIFSEAQWGGLE
jgi:hypothetical protein